MPSATGTRGYPVEVHHRAGRHRAGVGSTYLVFPTIGPTWERVPSTRGHHGGMCQKAAAKALVVASQRRGQGAGSGCRTPEPVGSDMGVAG
jgi:hypothetical protein